MSYTDQELETAVSQFVRDELQTTRDELGPLQTDPTFAEIQELAASTLIFDTPSIFYLLSLCANRVNQDVEQAKTYLEDIIDAISEMGRRTTKVTQTSKLVDAANAITDAERVLSDNAAVTQRPFSRYESALDSFTEVALTPNIREPITSATHPNIYKVVRTPQKAQTAIRTNLPLLVELHSIILTEVGQLRGALAEFQALDLPQLAMQTTLRQVRIDLKKLKQEFDAATADEAIELTRDAFLRLEAGKASMLNLTTIADPTAARMVGSSGGALTLKPANGDSATAARILTGVSAPFHIIPTSQDKIILAVDGGSDQQVDLTPEDPAEIIGQSGAPYDIHIASKATITASSGPYTIPVSPNNVFDIYVDGVGYRKTLTSGSRTAAQVAADANTATRIDGGPGTFQNVATASDVSGKLCLEHDTAGENTLTIGAQDTLNTVLGLSSNYTATGQEANNKIRFIVDDINSLEVTLTVGGVRTAAQVAADIASASVLIDSSAVTVEALPSDLSAVAVKSVSYGAGSYIEVAPTSDTHREAMETLGFTESQKSRSTYLGLDTLYEAIEALSGITASQDLTTVQEGTDGTAVKDGTAYKLRLPTGTLSPIPTTDDKLLITGGDNAGFYFITNVSAGGSYDELTLGRPLAAVTGDEALNQSWQIRRDYLIIESEAETKDSKLEVKTANANTELGLTVGSSYGSVSSIEVYEDGKTKSFSRQDIKAGDVVTVSSIEYGVVSLEDDGYRLEISPEIDNDKIVQVFRIDSEGYIEYQAFLEDLEAWDEMTEQGTYGEDLDELERKLNPLLTSRNPSATYINDADTAAKAVRDLYTELSDALAEFVVSEVPRIEALLDMLQERGLSRAYDLLLLAQIEDFFSTDKDEASYSGQLLKTMREVARNDMPIGVGADEDHVDSRLTGAFEDVDADYDFSDQDDETFFEEVDDIPDDDDVYNKSY